MPRLDIGVGEEFPIEEKPRAERCARHGYHHHHHHGSLRDMWRHRFGREDAAEQKKDKE